MKQEEKRVALAAVLGTDDVPAGLMELDGHDAQLARRALRTLLPRSSPQTCTPTRRTRRGS